MSSDDEARQVAAAFEATPELVPHLGELLGDLGTGCRRTDDKYIARG